MFTEQAVVHASQSLTSLSLNTTNTTQSLSPNTISQQNQYQQSRQNNQQQNKNNFHYHHQHYHQSPHHAQHHHHQEQDVQQQRSHNYHHHRPNKQVHTLPSSLPTSMESAISRRNSIIEHCSCGLTFKVDKNTNVNVITSSTSLLALNTFYNENPTLIDQTNNQGPLTQSQNILQDAQHHQHQQHHTALNKYSHHHHHQQHARHCHHHSTVTIPRYQSEPPEIHTHEYFSQESQTQDHTTTITNTTAGSSSATALAAQVSSNSTLTPHAHGCRHSHVHAQTDFSYGQR